MKKIIRILSIVGFLTVIIGAFIKILHWPYGTALLICGLIIYFTSVVLTYLKNNNMLN